MAATVLASSTIAAALTIHLLSSYGVSPSPSRQEVPRFRGGIELVEVPVSVTDAEGKPVTDLSIGDFEILERGRLQSIAMFHRISAPAVAPVGDHADTQSDVATNEFSRDTRTFVIILDDVHIQSHRTPLVKSVVRRLIERHIGQYDLVAVASSSGQRGLVQDFTVDKARILKLLDGFAGLKPAASGSGESAFLDPAHDAQATARTIGRFAEYVGRENRRRISFILVSEGIDFNIYDASDHKTADVVREIERAIQMLQRANVTLYAIDPRGLASIEADHLERFNKSSPETTSQMRVTSVITAPDAKEHLRLSIQSLSHFAKATGGFAAVNSNDYDRAFSRIVQEAGDYYLLGYYPNLTGQHRGLRDIAVKVRRSGVRVSARRGYMSGQLANHAPQRDFLSKLTSSRLAAGLSNALPSLDLPLRVQAIPLPGTQGRSRVQIIVEIAGRNLGFQTHDNRLSERLDVALLTVDGQGRKENGTSATVDLRLTADQLERVRLTGVRWLTALELRPGHYALRVAAHAVNTDRLGSVFGDIDVPTFSSQTAMSAIALTSAPAALAITTGTPSLIPQLPTPPTAMRTFVRGDVLHATAELYVSDSVSLPGYVSVRITRGTLAGSQALQQTVSVSESPDGRHWAMCSVPTDTLGLGRFVMQLELPSRPPSASRASATAIHFDIVDK